MRCGGVGPFYHQDGRLMLWKGYVGYIFSSDFCLGMNVNVLFENKDLSQDDF